MDKKKEPIRQDAGSPRQHNAPVFDQNHKPTGLKEAALADWNSRLIVGKEK
jgi:hypothetical protein